MNELLNRFKELWKINKVECVKKALLYGKNQLGKFIFNYPRTLKYKFLSNIRVLKGEPILCQPTLFCGKGEINIGNKVCFGVSASTGYYSGYSYMEARNEDSKIIIGSNTSINNNCCFISGGEGIFLGSGCLVGSNVTIYDSDFHDLEVSARNAAGKTAKVIIGNNVFIGSNVIILKGCTIGDNSVIGAGSVVSKSIFPNVVAAGNPCRVVKSL